jgi:protease-4
MELEGQIPTRSNQNPFDEIFNPQKTNQISLDLLKENMEKAAADDHISGVWLNIEFINASWATLQEARNALQTFQDSTDKFLYATTGDMGYNEKGYYLATAADSIFSPPSSLFEFDGFFLQSSFYKGLFDKLGIEVNVFRRGKYKSAVEPYIRTEHSEESRYQLQQIIDQVSGEYISKTSTASGLSADTLHRMLNDQPHFDASFAHEHGLIHQLRYPSEMDSLIKKRMNLGEEEEFHTVDSKRYGKVSASTAGLSTPSGEDKIALLYSSGVIVPQAPGSSPFDQQKFITASNFRKQLEDIREQDNVRALVVRINSPGGSGSTSDMIWKMLRNTAKDMPVIASMGPVAASGGYYIAMAADSIVAQPTTITGSIGVFTTKFNTKSLFNDKLGITFDRVKSHDHADWFDTNIKMSEDEERAMQHFTDQFYDQFIDRVAESRGLSRDEVHEDAQGRVWTGADAKNEKLVDVLGGLDKAISIASEKAGLADYSVITYPEQKKLIDMLMQSAESKAKSWLSTLLWDTGHSESLTRALRYKKGDALTIMPYKISIE